MIEFLIANKVILLGALAALSEVMALIPSFKSSGVFDFIYRAIRSAAGKPVIDKQP